ncbi:potassium channel family protein [Wenxinia marina]|uniref:K+ transport system, NAD-binding component n=1 Tax=Wenxinia marina DSM 24838 TaxID=1123501 RepID=A0A0D0Q1D9_9RHOB|nr:TrkA family potassium uptake protein [Wenxinia marina]KIQ68399.1 K+ transport system, NAD-binding component [Wenxinia marina DSM 24838]GGL72512.1 potassium transporter KtrA [Wenxinia marina]
MAKRRTFAVIGLGTFGSVVATELMRFGNDVIGIDIDRKVASDHAEQLSQSLILDSRDEQALREAGVGDCDAAIISMATDLEASILTAMNLKLVGVPVVWAKALNRTHHRILAKLGVDRIIHAEEEMGRNVAQILHNPYIRDYAAIGNGFHVVNFDVPDSLEGKTLADIAMLNRHDVRPIGVMRGTDWLGAGDCAAPLREDDRLILLGTRSNLRAFAETL